MKSVITIIIIFWVLWKILKRAIDEMQARMQDQMSRQKKPVPRPMVSTQRQTPARREPAGPKPARPGVSQEEMDLERLLTEALRRKQQMEGDEGIPLVITEERTVEPAPPPAERPQVVRQRTVSRRVEPHVRQQREVRVERRRVAMPREPAAVEPVQWQVPAAAAPRQRRGEEPRRRRTAREKSPVVEPVGIVRLGKRSVLRGVIMAEILGPPKSLRDIDSHVI